MQRDISHEFVAANGQQLHIARCGSGPLMLFVHGFPEFWHAWGAQLAHFGRGYLAVAPDMRGYNLSSKPALLSEYRPQVLVEDLRQLIVQLGAQEQGAIVVAHDWGGAVAWNLAARHPQLVCRLVIINAPHPYTFWRELRQSPAQLRASAYMNLFRDAKAERVLSENNYQRLLQMTFGDWGTRVPVVEAERQAYLAAWSQPGALTGGLNYYRASPLFPPTASEAGAAGVELDAAQFELSVPTLVIWGEQDVALLPGNLQGLERHVRDLRIVRVPDASHWIVHERSALVNQLIDDFIGGELTGHGETII